MKILAIEKEIKGVTKNMVAPFLEEEARKIWELHKKGIIREIYFTQDDRCAVLILECMSKSEAKKILNKLPLVKNKLIEFEIKPLVNYDGFERLFKK